MDNNEEDPHFHPRVKVDGRLIDEQMVDLMQAVWGFGLRTINCCQGGPEKPFAWAWIQFWDMTDGIKFLEGTAYLSDWAYGDDLHMYLTRPVVVQANPSPVVLMNYVLLPEITKLWKQGTAKPLVPETKE